MTYIQRLGDRQWLLTCTYFAGIRLFKWKSSFQGFSSTFIGIQVLSSPWFCYFCFQVLSRISSTCTNPEVINKMSTYTTIHYIIESLSIYNGFDHFRLMSEFTKCVSPVRHDQQNLNRFCQGLTLDWYFAIENKRGSTFFFTRTTKPICNFVNPDLYNLLTF
jgi:hypothetical protein